jgi:transposase
MVTELRAMVVQLQRRNKRQTAPFSKGPPKPDPKKPGRKPGDAYGKKGHREPPRPEDVEAKETYDAPLPDACPDCGHDGIQFDRTVPKWEQEIIRKTVWRLFNVQIGFCGACGRRVQGRHPMQGSDALGAAATGVGPEAHAMMTLLNKEMGLSHGKVVRFMACAYGLVLTRGASVQSVLRTGRRCLPAYRQILRVVRRSLWVVPDETGWRVAAILHWLWAFVTAQATAYTIRRGRGYEEASEVLGADYDGNMTHDGHKSYGKFERATHGQCNGHLLARCKRLLLVARRGSVRFPRAVKALLKGGLSLRDRHADGEVSDHGLDVARGKLQRRLDRLLEAPKRDPENERFRRHLDRHRDEIFTYLRFPGMDATNWKAEQAIRPAVVNRKVWGGNRTELGAEAQEVLMSVLRTCVQQGKDAMDFLVRVLSVPARIPPPLVIPARVAARSYRPPLALPAPACGAAAAS